MIDKYEDPFIKISSMIGGDEYLKVARSLLKAQDATDEEIASSTGLRINMVRKVLYDLFGKSLITGVRVKDERKGWFVYRWRSRRDEVENFIDVQKQKIKERLQQRLDYENQSEFYHCGNDDCNRIPLFKRLWNTADTIGRSKFKEASVSISEAKVTICIKFKED